MKVLIIGSGGREHALALKISQSKKVNKIYIAPGNAGTSQIGENIPIKPEETKKLLQFCIDEKIDLTVVGPEIPLSLGIVDLFYKNNLKIFGPTKSAAKIEYSKVFAKQLMKKNNIPTAEFKIFKDNKNAKKYLQVCKFPKVIKADGLASGKGVFVCSNKNDALETVNNIMVKKVFGDAGNKIIIEEFLDGSEASLICFTDGVRVLPMPIAKDHKSLMDNGIGPNTGGMGVYAPSGKCKPEYISIVKKTINALKKSGIFYKGILYTGLMITKKGPKVLEFNCRFGDPETQCQLMLIKSDLIDIIMDCISGRLKNNLQIYKRYSLCTVLASSGYPGNFKKGFPIYGLENTAKDINIFHATTKRHAKKIFTDGGRVLSVCALGKNLKEARNKVYFNIKNIRFKNMHYRHDIGLS